MPRPRAGIADAGRPEQAASRGVEAGEAHEGLALHGDVARRRLMPHGHLHLRRPGPLELVGHPLDDDVPLRRQRPAHGHPGGLHGTKVEGRQGIELDQDVGRPAGRVARASFLVHRQPSASRAAMASLVGSPACAPATVVLRAAPAMAQRSASSRLAPRASSAARMPFRASPAPVVSTGRTGVAGRCRARPSAQSKAPSAPSETMTGAPVRPESRAAAASGSAAPASSAASVAFGVRIGPRASSASADGPRWRRVDDDPEAEPARPGRGSEDGLVGDLEADEADGAARNGEACRLLRDDGAVQPGVGPGGHGDLVLARVVHHDEGQPGVLAGQATARRDVDPLGGETLQGAPPEVVVADGAEHDHSGPGAAGGHGLVGALAAVLLHEPITQHRLTGHRQARDSHDEVHVDGAGHDDRPWCSCHVPTMAPRAAG